MTAQDADSETQIASLLALSQEWADSMDAGIAGDSATFLDQLFGHFQRKYPGNNGLTYGRPQHHSLEPEGKDRDTHFSEGKDEDTHFPWPRSSHFQAPRPSGESPRLSRGVFLLRADSHADVIAALREPTDAQSAAR